MQNIQNKIDRLILNGNEEFSQQSNVIGALVEYSRVKGLLPFLDRKYKVQLHEVLVRITICWDILGNYAYALDYLNKALELINNIPCLVIYQAFLEQLMSLDSNAQEHLGKYKRLVGKRGEKLSEIFRLVFYYTSKCDKKVLLAEINSFFEKYSKCTVLLYLRASIYFEFARCKEKDTQCRGKAYSELISKYENDINEATKIESNDTNCLIRDGITRENITKLFFMIVPEMDYYQPKPLVNYSSFQCGFKLFYVIFKSIKLFKAKLQKKKLKAFYIRKIKLTQLRDSSPELLCAKNGNSHTHDSSHDKILQNTLKRLSKSPLQSSDRNNIKSTNNKEATGHCELIQLKREYERNLKKINNSVFFTSMNLFNDIGKFDLDVDLSSNYFIRKKYYAPFNLSATILSLQDISDDPFYKGIDDSLALFKQLEDNLQGRMLHFRNGLAIDNKLDEYLPEFSLSQIGSKHNQDSDFNVTNELNFFDPKESPVNLIPDMDSNKKIPDLLTLKLSKLSKPVSTIKKVVKIDFKRDQPMRNKEKLEDAKTPKGSIGFLSSQIKEKISKKQLVMLNYEEICKRRISPDIMGKKIKINFLFGKNKKANQRHLNSSHCQKEADSKSTNNLQDNTGNINNTNEL